MAPVQPAWPKAPLDRLYWPENYSDPNFVGPEPHTLCDPSTIPHSNRSTAATQCMDTLTPFPHEGTECFFECIPGYMPIGRHVCQWHDFDWIESAKHHTDPDHNLRRWNEEPSHKRAFYGGRCQKMCGDPSEQSCPIGQSTRRFPKSMLTSAITDAHAMHEEHGENDDDDIAHRTSSVSEQAEEH